jgi:cytochrome c oxidase subunit 3
MGRGSGTGREAALPLSTAQLGVWALLGTITMLFAGFTSAYLVRRVGSDWWPLPLPGVLWFNTGILVLSSITLELARAAMKRLRLSALKGWLLLTTTLGLVFLGGQFVAWRELVAQGVYLPTSPHGAFFYILTGLHGLHVLGGVLALLYALNRAWAARLAPGGANPVNLCATYWHFVGGLWLYLFVLLFT